MELIVISMFFVSLSLILFSIKCSLEDIYNQLLRMDPATPFKILEKLPPRGEKK